MPRKISDDKLELLRAVYAEYGGQNARGMSRELNRRGWRSFAPSMFYRYGTPTSTGLINRYGLDRVLSAKQLSGVKASRAKAGFGSWIKTTSTELDWRQRFHRLINKKLSLVTSGKIKRLMLFLPPRHGKSEMVTVRYAAWRLIRDPKLNVIVGSYNQKLADRFSLKIKRIVKEFGPAEPRSRDLLRTASEWETGHGGGVKAVGVGAGITGFGADLIIIDDPVKSRAEAESKTYRERVWDWFNDDIYTRLAPGAGIILIQTRWHEDDLAGRLLRQSGEDCEVWEDVTLPALAESRNAEERGATLLRRNAGTLACNAACGVTDAVIGADEVSGDDVDSGRCRVHAGKGACVPAKGRDARVPTDGLGRQRGEALWPERFPVERLDAIRRQLGTNSFSALYQQRPVPSSGGIFKRGWFTRRVKVASAGLSWARGYDLAVSTRTSADYTASFRCAFDEEENLYIAGGFRKRIEYPEQRRYVIERLQVEKGTIHGIEKALHGQALVQDIWRDARVRGRALRAVQVDGDKVTRAHAWASKAEAGKVILVEGPWIDEFLDEVCSFPQAAHDDQVDAVSLAVRLLRQPSRGAHGERY